MQASLFSEDAAASSRESMPSGFRYQSDLISEDEEAILLAHIADLDFKPYMFRGYPANRKVIAYGYMYDYGTRSMQTAPDIPPFLQDLRARVAQFAGRSSTDFRQVLVTEYSPGTALAWHRDRLQYGEIVGVSLRSAATFRVRQRTADGWRRASRLVEPRSVYQMAGDVRMDWEHSIPAVESLRYSLTFRTFAENFTPPSR
jgi:alkylated DNA repair dioxygenase AlkB